MLGHEETASHSYGHWYCEDVFSPNAVLMTIPQGSNVTLCGLAEAGLSRLVSVTISILNYRAGDALLALGIFVV
jgi:hypothetical protein